MMVAAAKVDESSVGASRIDRRFEALRGTGRKALIPFVTAGDPSPAQTVDLMLGLVQAGADLIELGIPFSDPMADGPVIQRASARALSAGVGAREVLAMVEQFRRYDMTTPIVLMGYANPIERLGLAWFAEQAASAGVDGVLVVDYPPEEADEAMRLFEAHGVSMIFLLAPTSTPQRIDKVARIARGYVYFVSLAGVTGAGHLNTGMIAELLPTIRASVPVPVGVGFGIRDEESAREVSRHCDGVVIGSRIIELMEQGPADQAIDVATRFVRSIRLALDRVGDRS